MVIANSTVSMASTNYYREYAMHKLSVNRKVTDDEQKENLGFFQNLLNQSTQIDKTKYSDSSVSSQLSIKLQLLHKIFAAILGRKNMDDRDAYAVRSETIQMNGEYNTGMSLNGTVWQLSLEDYYEYHETQCTSFQSKGLAVTEDGRTIEFGVNLSMSRNFTEVYSEYRSMQYFITDPLIINVGNDITSVTDVKFMFDLDSDGTQEEISFAGKGSGFLALDLNGDGVINDGTELFGTKSGDGFSDLAKYDSDGNGWIDEADDIFDRLRVWTKDENGNDELMDLKTADVGAIYLGSAITDFALTDDNNYANAFIRSTGIYLKESGGVGTIAQVDMTT